MLIIMVTAKKLTFFLVSLLSTRQQLIESWIVDEHTQHTISRTKYCTWQHPIH